MFLPRKYLRLLIVRPLHRTFVHWFWWVIEKCSMCNQSISVLLPRKFNQSILNVFNWYHRSLGLEITPKVRFMKKGQKQETDTKPSTEKEENIANLQEQLEEEEDDDWFKVKEKSNILDEIIVDLPVPTNKEKKISKVQLAKKLRKKNLLINKRVEYDEEGNVSLFITKMEWLLSLRQSNALMRKINHRPTTSKKQKLVFTKKTKKIKKFTELWSNKNIKFVSRTASIDWWKSFIGTSDERKRSTSSSERTQTSSTRWRRWRKREERRGIVVNECSTTIIREVCLSSKGLAESNGILLLSVNEVYLPLNRRSRKRRNNVPWLDSSMTTPQRLSPMPNNFLCICCQNKISISLFRSAFLSHNEVFSLGVATSDVTEMSDGEGWGWGRNGTLKKWDKPENTASNVLY